MDKCRFCEAQHGPVCPLVKALEYYPDGSLKKVEFKTAADWAMPFIPMPSNPAPQPNPFMPWPPIVTCKAIALQSGYTIGSVN